MTKARYAENYCRKYQFALVPIPPGKKFPTENDWGNKVISSPTEAFQYFSQHPDWNMGVALGPSRICSFDVDDLEATQLIFNEFGWDLLSLSEDYPTIQGAAPKFRCMFRVPDGFELPYHALSWPKKDGSAGRFTVFELRSAVDQQRQDVLPPSIHPVTKQPYQWITPPNGHIPDLPEFLIKLWENWDKLKPQLQSVCPWAEKPKAPAPKRQSATPRDGSSVIEQYNAAVGILDALTTYGYKQQGNRWLSPHSTTKLPGVMVWEESNKCFIHHASDPLCSDESGQPVGPFDLFCHYDHGGDVRKAVKAAANFLGLESKPQVQRPSFNVDQETGEILSPANSDQIPDYIDNIPGEGLTPEQLSDIGRQAPNGPTIIFSTSPMQTAEKFAEKMPGGGRILFWRGDFYAWDGCRYALQDRVRIEQRLYHFMAQCWTEKTDPKTKQVEVIPFNPKRNLVDDVYHALRAVCFVDLPEPQCWIDEHQADYPPHEIVAFRNGFLHWPSRMMMKPTDRLFVVNVIDFDFDPNAPEPAEWHKFLGNLWADDCESVQALAEMFGYLLTDDVSQQKMFMLIGPPRSGKGTILRVLESMVGYHNRVSPSMSSLGTQFGLQPLIGKRVAMISDARLSGKADQQPIVECLLTISGEDSMTVQRKHIGPWEGKLPTRFVLASNEIPAFSDASSALASRFILFKFTQSFLGREDHGLTSRLLKELPGIVLWALAGLDRLKQRGYLLQPQSSNDIAQDLLEQTSPVRTFVSERCVIGGQEYTVDKDDLFKEWKLWCIEQGRDFPGTKISFGRQLSAAFAGIKRCQPRENGTRLNLYQGIRLKLHFEQD